jgi:hypothetical protein
MDSTSWLSGAGGGTWQSRTAQATSQGAAAQDRAHMEGMVAMQHAIQAQLQQQYMQYTMQMQQLHPNQVRCSHLPLCHSPAILERVILVIGIASLGLPRYIDHGVSSLQANVLVQCNLVAVDLLKLALEL